MKILRVIKDINQIVIPPGMRKIKYIFFHCTAGPQSQTTEEIFNYWKKHNGWKTAGYHFDINADGSIEQLVEIGDVANGVKNYNSNSIHICYKGGIDKTGKPVDNRTTEQKASQIKLISRMKALFPDAIHLGHRDISLDQNGNGILESWEWIKSCPAYDHRAWVTTVAGLDKFIIPRTITYKLHDPAIKNRTVAAIQYALGIKQDEYFGVGTTTAVKGFQLKNNLTVDGVVGEATAKALIKWLHPEDHKSGEYALLLADIKNN